MGKNNQDLLTNIFLVIIPICIAGVQIIGFFGNCRSKTRKLLRELWVILKEMEGYFSYPGPFSNFDDEMLSWYDRASKLRADIHNIKWVWKFRFSSSEKSKLKTLLEEEIFSHKIGYPKFLLALDNRGSQFEHRELSLDKIKRTRIELENFFLK